MIKITEGLKTEIKLIPPEMLEAHGVIQPAKIKANGYQTYVCPFCSNGTGKDGSGLVVSLQTGVYTYTCFAGCGKKGYDNIHLLAHYYGLDSGNAADFITICEQACDEFGISYEDFTTNAARGKATLPKKATTQAAEIVDTETGEILATDDVAAREAELIRSDIISAQSNLKSFIDKQGGKWRGLTYETLNNFGCGFDEDWVSPKIRAEFDSGKRDNLPPVSQRVIIPSGNHYLACLPAKFRTPENKQWWKMHAGVKELFNRAAINPTTTVLIVVEGEIDAMSIWQIYGDIPVVATMGAGGGELLINALNSIEFAAKPNVFICFDSDEAGVKNANKLHAALISEGYPAAIDYFDKYVAGDKIDANAILTSKGTEQLRVAVFAIIESEDNQNQFDAAKKLIADKAAERFYKAKKAAINASIDAAIADLQKQLDAVKLQQAEFQAAEIDAGIEHIKNLNTFDSATLFTPETLKGAAAAKLYDKQAWSELKTAIQNYKRQNSGKGVSLPDFNAAVKGYVDGITARAGELQSQYNAIAAEIKSKRFARNNDIMSNLIVPKNFTISDDGVTKATPAGNVIVCRRPIIITGKYYSVESKSEKYALSYKTGDKWRTLPPYEAAVIFNKSTLTALSNFGLPVSSSNAFNVVDYLDAFKVDNELALSVSLIYKTGWQTIDSKSIFVDPRRNLASESGERIIVEDTAFTSCLHSKGSISDWRRAYELAKQYPLARLIVAAAVATPLLKICDERNFVVYIYCKTRAGKSTALLLGNSANGDERLMRSFDATKNGLAGTVAEFNDYAFCVDEKQVADGRIDLKQLIYALANGTGRARLNKDATLKAVQYWRSVIIANGETELLEDNTTGGAYSRLLQIKAPDVLIPPNECKEIRSIVKDNYGLALPLVLEVIDKLGAETVREKYQTLVDRYYSKYPEVINDYCRYVAVLAIADWLLNMAVGVDADDANLDSVRFAKAVLKDVPRITDIDDTAREWDFVAGFIAENQRCFISNATPPDEINRLPAIYGRFAEDEVYITAKALKTACKQGGYNYNKLVNDLTDEGYFIKPSTAAKDRTAKASIQAKIGNTNARCFKISKNLLINDD